MAKNKVSILDLITVIYLHKIVVFVSIKLSLFVFCSKTKTNPKNSFFSMVSQLDKCLKFKSIPGDKNDIYPVVVLYRSTGLFKKRGSAENALVSTLRKKKKNKAC